MLNFEYQNLKIDNIDTVLFDKDGTFIDLHYFWGKMTELRASEVIKRYHLENDIHSELCMFLGFDVGKQKMLSDGITAMYSRPQIIEIFRKDLLKFNVVASQSEIESIFDDVSQMFYKEMEKYTKPIESAISFIKLLRQKNIKVGIVTSDSKESSLLTIKHYCWEDLFDVVIGRESTKENKESGVPVKLALETLKSNPENTVMVGDAPMDYIAAKNAGVENVILVSTGQIENKELQKTCDFVVDSLMDITIN